MLVCADALSDVLSLLLCSCGLTQRGCGDIQVCGAVVFREARTTDGMGSFCCIGTMNGIRAGENGCPSVSVSERERQRIGDSNREGGMDGWREGGTVRASGAGESTVFFFTHYSLVRNSSVYHQRVFVSFTCLG